MTLLALDIGNTRLKWALYAAPHPGSALLAQGAEFLENIDKLSVGAWHDLPEPRHILGCAVAADAIKRRIQEQMELWDATPQWVVASEAEAGLSNGYDHPTRLGADRWVAMVGAYHRMRAQGAPRPMVVVMVGTAVTVEAIDAEGKRISTAEELDRARLEAAEGTDFELGTLDADLLRIAADCALSVGV